MLSSSNNLTAICSEPKPNVESKTNIMHHNHTIEFAYMIMSRSLGFGYAYLPTHLGDYKRGTLYSVLIQQSYRYYERYIYPKATLSLEPTLCTTIVHLEA